MPGCNDGTFTTGPIRIPQGARDIYPNVAWDGDAFLVVWIRSDPNGEDWDHVPGNVSSSGSLISNTLVVGTALGRPTKSPARRHPASASSSCGRTTRSWRYEPVGHLRKVGERDGVVDFNKPTLQLTTMPSRTDNYAQTWPGTAASSLSCGSACTACHRMTGTWWAAWQARASGTTSGSNFSIASPSSIQTNPSVASDGSRFEVVWDDNRQGTFDIYGSVVTGNGGVGNNTPISSSTRISKHPRSPSTGNAPGGLDRGSAGRQPITTSTARG